MRDAVSKYSRVKPLDNVLLIFSQQLYYHRSQFHEDEGYQRLRTFLNDLDLKYDTKGNRVYYLYSTEFFSSDY